MTEKALIQTIQAIPDVESSGWFCDVCTCGVCRKERQRAVRYLVRGAHLAICVDCLKSSAALAEQLVLAPEPTREPTDLQALIERDADGRAFRYGDG